MTDLSRHRYAWTERQKGRQWKDIAAKMGITPTRVVQLALRWQRELHKMAVRVDVKGQDGKPITYEEYVKREGLTTRTGKLYSTDI